MRGYVPELDGIRGIAILLVILFHFGACSFGWLGVDLFFVLSGFLITGILLDAKGRDGYFKNFYLRRALRTMPLYYAGVAVLFAVVMPRMGHDNPGLKDLPLFLLHLSNWQSAYDKFIESWTTHFWSLAIEEQFYFVWPLIIALVPRRSLVKVVCALIVVPVVIRFGLMADGVAYQYSQLIYRLTPTRIDGLALGALAALAIREESVFAVVHKFRKPAISVAALMLILCATVGGLRVDSPLMWMFGYSAAAVLFMYAVLSGYSGSLVFQSRLLVQLGKYSYGLYVIHWPVALWLQDKYGHGSVWVMVAGITISYVLAVASWNILENPFLRLKDAFTPRHATEKVIAQAA